MSRPLAFVLLAATLPLLSAAQCPPTEPSVTGGDPVQIVTLGQDAYLWWDTITACGEGQAPSGTATGGGTANGSATFPNPPRETSPALGVQVSAPHGADASASWFCSIQAEFTVDPDPSLAPGAIQGVMGSIVCEISHFGVVADSRNYLLRVELSVTSSATTDVQQAVLEFSDMVNPYQGGDDRLEVRDVWFQAGETYTVDLEVFGQIVSIQADPSFGGSVEFDVAPRELRVEFGLSP
jgi:hypothetical protein